MAQNESYPRKTFISKLFLHCIKLPLCPAPGFTKNHIVVIGGTTGIGLSAAQAFVEHGAKVVVVGRNEESVDKATSSFKRRRRRNRGRCLDARYSLASDNLCKKKFGSFHGLYHVAGGSGRKFGDGPLHELTLEGWNQTFQLNLTSLMLSNQEAIKVFLEQKTPGTILNMGSVLGFSPSPKHFVTHAYAATKSAVIGFTKSIASYYATNDIRVNVLAPALVETPMAQRAAKDEIILDFIKTKQPLDGGRIWSACRPGWGSVYFMSDYSRFTTGQVLAVDGGWSISEGQY